MKTKFFLLTLFIFGCFCCPLFADYVVPEPTAQCLRLIAPGNWTLQDHTLRIQGESTSYVIDDFWLCHYRNSDAICTGKVREASKKVFQELSAGQGKSWLWVRVLRLPGKESRVIATDLRLFDRTIYFDNASKIGAYELGLKPEDVKKLDATALEQKLQVHAKNSWVAFCKSPKPAAK